MPEIRIIGDGVVIEQLDASLDETRPICCYRDPIACNCPPARRQRKAMELESLSAAQMLSLDLCMRSLVRAHRRGQQVSEINHDVLVAILESKGWTRKDL